MKEQLFFKEKAGAPSGFERENRRAIPDSARVFGGIRQIGVCGCLRLICFPSHAWLLIKLTLFEGMELIEFRFTNATSCLFPQDLFIGRRHGSGNGIGTGGLH